MPVGAGASGVTCWNPSVRRQPAADRTDEFWTLREDLRRKTHGNPLRATSQLLKASLSLAHGHSDANAALYLWFASTHLRDVLACLEEAGWQERSLLVWVKDHFAGSLFAQFKHQFEPCFYAHKRGESPRWRGPTNESTVWFHDKPAHNDLHPTMKPLALIERAISNSTAPRQLVVDPFLGSGTAIIAAERTGRVCYGMDLEPRYCDVMLRRWEEFSGQPANKLAPGAGLNSG
jgi:hypothetical protein